MKLFVVLYIGLIFSHSALAQTLQVETYRNLHVLHARLIDKTTHQPVAGRHAYVSVPGRVFEFRTATSDSAGNLKFLIKNLEASKQVVFQANDFADSNFVVEVNMPFAEKFKAEQFQGRIKEVGDTLPFYGKADKDYLLDDYVRFPTMEEVLREFVAEVRVRKQRDRFRFEVLNLPYKLFFENEPLVLLDGVPVFDMNKIMEIDPLKIRNIQVVAKKYYFGSLVLSGIVVFTSYDGDLAGYKLPPQAQVRDVTSGSFVK
jgi:hypothetical protein